VYEANRDGVAHVGRNGMDHGDTLTLKVLQKHKLGMGSSGANVSKERQDEDGGGIAGEKGRRWAWRLRWQRRATRSVVGAARAWMMNSQLRATSAGSGVILHAS
jgi:hypothetical protein